MARLLMEERLRDASPEELSRAVDAGFEQLAEGIVAEASASDDVVDRESALAFVNARIEFLGPLLSNDQKQRLRAAIEEKVASW
jgi:hypothetical protein